MSRRKVKRKGVTEKQGDKGRPLEVRGGLLRRHGLKLLIVLFLIVVTLAVFWPVRNHEFLNYDDNEYVTDNPHVKTGLTLKGVIWAFTTTHASNWHPLTWLSHMLDYELYGLRPGGHHLINLLLHIANTLLLFLVLKRMTGGLWGSSFVAALFALHPLHVESVSWVAERKDVWSTFFWMLTMWTYVRYVDRPRLKRYLLVLLFFTLGLLSKPMLVTLPFVLLLLDYWPLGRFQFGQSSGYHSSNTHKSKDTSDQRSVALRLILEKAPFFVLAAVSSFLTIFAQQRGGALSSLELFPLGIRIANALVSYVNYIGKMIWPHHLAVFYPYPDKLPMWQVVGAGLLLMSVSVLVIYTVRKRPYLAVGWVWYLGTLVPVIGLVQVGGQAMADRYTYVPLIGLFIMIAEGVPDILTGWRYRRVVLAVSVGLILSIFMIVTRLQVQYWHDSITLFKHTLGVTANNFQIHNNLGVALAEQGKNQEAIAHFTEALRIKPDFAEAHSNLGVALAEQGKNQEAIAHYTEALRIKPDYVKAHYNLGVALAEQGKNQEATAHFTEALRIKPDYAEAHNNLGIALAGQGKIQEGIDHFAKAVRLKPDYAEAHINLGLAYLMMGNRGSALEEYKILKAINPDLANNLSQKIFK